METYEILFIMEFTDGSELRCTANHSGDEAEMEIFRLEGNTKKTFATVYKRMIKKGERHGFDITKITGILHGEIERHYKVKRITIASKYLNFTSDCPGIDKSFINAIIDTAKMLNFSFGLVE
jgi:hypothetical protein